MNEVEDALRPPTDPTTYSPIVVHYVQVGTMSHSQIQQGSAGSLQIQQTLDVSGLRELVAELRAITPELALEGNESDEYEADVEMISAQLTSPQPKPSILRESLSSARAILKSAAGAGVATGTEHLAHLMERVAQAIVALPS